MPRMPPLTQRRNFAYLNRLIARPTASTGLAIDLGGSVERCFRPDDLDRMSVRYRDAWAPRQRRDDSGDDLQAEETICAV